MSARQAPGHLGPNAAAEWEATYRRCFREAMSGDKAVFAATYSEGLEHDNEQGDELLAAVGLVLRCPGNTADDIGIAVLQAVSRIANDYASWKADEAALQIREDYDMSDPDLDTEAA